VRGHLEDPWSVLEGYVRLPEPGCRAVISLPNANHWTTYAALARGSWPRRPEGIHDATHLRWFTLRDAIELCEGAGLKVEHVEKRPWLLWRGTRLDRHAGPLARLAPFTFQHVLAARRAYHAPPMSAPAQIFKAYDIRGLYGDEIDGDIAEQIGRAFVRVLASMHGKDAADLRVGLGRDMRLQAPELAGRYRDGMVSE